MKRFWVFTLVLLIPLALIGCASSNSDPSNTITAYLQALVAKDTDKAVSLSCADWEEDARAEVDALESVTPSLKGVSCVTTDQTPEQASVTCIGKLVTTYNGEDQELDLSRQIYQLKLEDGQWRMCGYQ
jgi:hypothetical protein